MNQRYNMTIRRGKVWLLASLMLLTTVVTSCGNSQVNNADKTTFTIATWAAGVELQEFQEIVDQVNQEAGDRYAIDVMSIPSDYYVKISTYIAAKKTPDFFWLTQELISKYAQVGAILDITESFEQSEKLTPDLFYDGVLSSAEYNDHYYGLPWIANPLMMYYNKDMFDEAGIALPSATEPMTWEEMIKTAEQLTTVKQDTLGNDYQQYGYIVDGWPNIETFLWAGGGDVIDENRVDVLLDSEPSLQGLDLLHTILTSGISPAYNEISSFGSNNVWFQKQRVGMFMGGIQDNFEKKMMELPPEEQFEIGYAPMPVGADGKPHAFNWTASTVMSAGLEGNDLAYEAMEALTMKFFQWKLAPPLKGSADQVETIDPLKKDAVETIGVSLEYARSAYYVPEWNEINNLLWVELYTGMLNDPDFDYRNKAKEIAEQSRNFISKRK